MSKPKTYKPGPDALEGVRHEIMQATSCLHSEPDPLPVPAEFVNSAQEWLSSTDANVKHAVEHLHSACEALRAHNKWVLLLQKGECEYAQGSI